MRNLRSTTRSSMRLTGRWLEMRQLTFGHMMQCRLACARMGV